jgi:hypothetical protein
LETKFLQSFARVLPETASDGLGTAEGLAMDGLGTVLGIFRNKKVWKRKVWGGQGVGENLETKSLQSLARVLPETAREGLGRSWDGQGRSWEF